MAAPNHDSASSSALARMDLRAIMRAYLRQAAADVPGYKALLLDRETVRVTSTLMGRGELADAGVVLIERVDLPGAGAAASVGAGTVGAPSPPPSSSSSKPVEHPELRAVALLRPTRENVAALKRELRQPRFQSYHLYFTHIVNPMLLQDLAEADSARELVLSVAESYADVVALSPSHFAVPLLFPRNAQLVSPGATALEASGGTLPPGALSPPSVASQAAAAGLPSGGGLATAFSATTAFGGGGAGGGAGGGGFGGPATATTTTTTTPTLPAPPQFPSAAAAEAQFETLDRLVQGLSAVCLAVRRRPVVRFQRGSEPAARVAEAVFSLCYRQQPGVFDFGSRAAPLLLVLDRRDDPATPLLTQWTYEAMAHELLGTTDGTARLCPPPPGLEGSALAAAGASAPEELKQGVVLDRDADAFFARHALSNYGEVGSAVREAVQSFAARTAAHRGGGGGGGAGGGGGGGGGSGTATATATAAPAAAASRGMTLEEMKRFVLEHGDFQRAQAGVAKHVNVMSCLSASIAGRGLMDVSPLEQELATAGTSGGAGGIGGAAVVVSPGGGGGGSSGADATPPGLAIGAAAAAYEAVMRVVRALPPLSAAPGPAAGSGSAYEYGGGGGTSSAAATAAAANAAAALRLARQAPTDAAAAATVINCGQPGGKPGRSFPADKDAARLVALYALRHGEADPRRLALLVDALASAGVRERSPVLFAAVATALLPLCGAHRRAGDLFGTRSGLAGGILAKAARAIAKGFTTGDFSGNGGEGTNVYTQHQPLLTATLRQVATGALSAQQYPFVASGAEEAAAWAAAYRQRPPQEVIVFIVGGTTYEEARAVEEWNARQGQQGGGGGGGGGGGVGGSGDGFSAADPQQPQHPPMRVILGGSGVLNSDMFLAALGGGAVSVGAAAAGGLGVVAEGGRGGASRRATGTAY